MYLDIVDLRDFYASDLGQLARRLLLARMRQVWPDTAGMCVVGLGYATPYLGLLRDRAERVLAFMPARQGVVRWPSDRKCRAALVDETRLPMGDGTVDLLIMVHCLEMSDSASELLHEARRVLAGGGRLIVAVPYRRGLWSRFEHTPFGYGHPYSRSQLVRLLRETQFTPARWQEALWLPPFRHRFLIRSLGVLERLGAWLAMPPGLVMVEATKQVQAAIPIKPKRARNLRPVLVGEPAASARLEMPNVESDDHAGRGVLSRRAP